MQPGITEVGGFERGWRSGLLGIDITLHRSEGTEGPF
jgi:hypothetical protein